MGRRLRCELAFAGRCAAVPAIEMKLALFTVYSIAYEAIIWGMFGWAVFEKGHSGWWMLLAAILSSAQMKPKHFGINSDAK